MAYGTLPLRIFLGVTFVYAGLQKISDPGFLQPGGSTYIGTQLQAFAAHSPIGFLIGFFALPVPQLAGIGVIPAEPAIGALVPGGLAPRWAAAAGAPGSPVFFPAARWAAQPGSARPAGDDRPQPATLAAAAGRRVGRVDLGARGAAARPSVHPGRLRRRDAGGEPGCLSDRDEDWRPFGHPGPGIPQLSGCER